MKGKIAEGISAFTEGEQYHPLAQHRQCGQSPVVYQVGLGKQELINWHQRPDGLQSQSPE